FRTLAKAASRRFAALARADAATDLAAHDFIHGPLARADPQPARPFRPIAMERCRPGRGREGAFRRPHRRVFPSRPDTFDTRRMEHLKTGLGKVIASMFRPVAAVAIVCAITVVFLFGYWPVRLIGTGWMPMMADDAFYYLRIAQNLVTSGRSTFDGQV